MQTRPVNPQKWLESFNINQAIEVTRGQRVLYVPVRSRPTQAVRP